MIEHPTRTKSLTKIKLAFDIMIFLAFLIAMEPHSSGITVHEWLATSLIAALVVHLLLSWDWIVQTTQRFLRKINSQTRLNYILNWLLFIDGAVIMLSGFMISEAVLPSLGVTLPRNFAWRSLHDLSANLFIVLLGIHTALHWKWIVDAFKRYGIQPVARLFSVKAGKDVTA